MKKTTTKKRQTGQAILVAPDPDQNFKPIKLEDLKMSEAEMERFLSASRIAFGGIDEEDQE